MRLLPDVSIFRSSTERPPVFFAAKAVPSLVDNENDRSIYSGGTGVGVAVGTGVEELGVVCMPEIVQKWVLVIPRPAAAEQLSAEFGGMLIPGVKV
jgi:hypothetical protein